MIERVNATIGEHELCLETGRMAKQAHGSVTVSYGGTVVLATAVAGPVREGIGFFPLTIEYREKTYAAGRIPGNFFRREGRPSEKEVLTCRLVDRPFRPLFADGYKNDVQVVTTVLSADQENDPDILALVGGSAALMLSAIPFYQAVGAVRVGWVDGGFTLNPTFAELEASKLNLVVAGTEKDVVMVEGWADELPETVMVDAIEFGHRALQKSIELQMDLVQKAGVEKIRFEAPARDEALAAEVERLAEQGMNQTFSLEKKQDRQKVRKELLTDIQTQLATNYEDRESEIEDLFEEYERRIIRDMILKEGRRADGRGCDDVRQITCDIGLLPRAHGSALFTRGETQALVATTLGTTRDEQKLDELQGESFRNFIMHYNFPPFSVGEVKPFRGPGRREIGHGVLNERALRGIMPADEDFPYTVRIVSDILESNGSSSMATVCGASLALMDAGVPIKTAVGGIAMGLVQEDGEVAILSDITGLEDHLGDMDFKVAGTAEGITAFQMDVKAEGISRDTLARALEQARVARLFILDKMNAAISGPREEISRYAPRIFQITIPVEKIGAVIGPGGKVIRDMTAKTGASIDIDDDGTITVASVEVEGAEKALEMINQIIADVEVGKIYKGRVTRLMNFGAFVEVLPGKEGLVHISALAPNHVKSVEDVVKVGDEIQVKCVEIDNQNRVNLSKVAAERELGLIPDTGEEPPRRPRDAGRRGPRDSSQRRPRDRR
jgi:polyribonucleotide nucleotidyltransferase